MYLDDRGGWFVSRNDFEDSVDFVGWYNYKTHKQLGISLTNARALYLAYHEGHGGYKKGTYKSKEWLVEVARKVKMRANRYESQLSECENNFSKKFLGIF